MGVPHSDIHSVGSLLGTKMVINEFVAYTKLSPMVANLARLGFKALICGTLASYLSATIAGILS